MLLPSPFPHKIIHLDVTLHNELPDGDTPTAAWLCGNVLFFQVVNDRDIRPEEDDNMYFYEVTDEQRDKILSWPLEERNLSVEWRYAHNDGPSLEPYEWEDLSEDEQELYSLELDVSI